LSRFNYFGLRNFGVFTSYYTETLLYSNFRGPLFSRTCQARKKWVLQYFTGQKSLKYINIPT